MAVLANGQSLADSVTSSSTIATTTPAQLNPVYLRPTQRTRLRNYVFDAFGPYPVVGVAIAAGINQADNTPPEWKRGTEAYSKRFASDLGIAAVTTTTRYGLAGVFREDTLYYRCECKGVYPRLRHALISTFAGRRGDDGHAFFHSPL